MTYDISEGLAALDQIAAAEKIATPMCSKSCGRFAVVRLADDGGLYCEVCAKRAARALKRAARFERKRQERMFPKAMSVPKGKR